MNTPHIETLALSRTKLFPVCGALLLVLACGSRTSGIGTDTSTDWLIACERDEQCGSGLSCECGICTLACATDVQCSELGTKAVCKPTPQGCDETALCVRETTFDDVSITTPDGSTRATAGDCASNASCATWDTAAPLPETSTSAPAGDAGAGATQAFRRAEGMWETSSFEDPLFLRLVTLNTDPSARVCSAEFPPTTYDRPEDMSLAEFILSSGGNCDNAPVIELAGEELKLKFAIPWSGLLPEPARYDLVVVHDLESDTLVGKLTPVGFESPIDVTWTRPTL